MAQKFLGFRAAIVAVFVGAVTSPAAALDLNSFRAQHGRPALSPSASLAGIAYGHANDMAARNHLDHNGFRESARASGGAWAQNVAVITCARPDARPLSTFAGRACGCEDEDCAIRIWAKSGGHRANMLRGDVSAYGLASARSENGRPYWVLELGN